MSTDNEETVIQLSEAQIKRERERRNNKETKSKMEKVAQSIDDAYRQTGANKEDIELTNDLYDTITEEDDEKHYVVECPECEVILFREEKEEEVECGNCDHEFEPSY